MESLINFKSFLRQSSKVALKRKLTWDEDAGNLSQFETPAIRGMALKLEDDLPVEDDKASVASKRRKQQPASKTKDACSGIPFSLQITLKFVCVCVRFNHSFVLQAMMRT